MYVWETVTQRTIQYSLISVPAIYPNWLCIRYQQRQERTISNEDQKKLQWVGIIR